MKHIGILGGTFDPPHFGHLLLAEEVRVALSLDEIWFIPTYEPPHKKKSATLAKDRLAMLQKAIKGNNAFKVNSIEMDRLGKSFTIDTIKKIKKAHVEDKFYFIIGADLVESLATWHQINDLKDLVQFVVVNRIGYQMNSPYPIKQVNIPSIDISSTIIRNRLNKNQTVHYLLPEKVYNYIKEHRLYEGQ